jgi:hypothetical protein
MEGWLRRTLDLNSDTTAWHAEHFACGCIPDAALNSAAMIVGKMSL